MAEPVAAPEHHDVIIIGAGLSGVGAACHLRRELPELDVVIMESRAVIGGTWDLFRYPGVRSDSDMFTLGYDFAPWSGPTAIADGAAILAYVRDTATAYGVDRLVRPGHRVRTARWDREQARWVITVDRTGADGRAEMITLSCDLLWSCTGYYRYDHGYTPELPGLAQFAGPVVHPQHWPADLDVTGRRVVVIGSGATAITLVPALAERAASVIMLQRSPSYVASIPAVDATALRLQERRLPRRWAAAIVRTKKIITGMFTFQLSRRRPETMKALLRRQAGRLLPAAFDLDTHLSPTYAPWDQRLCATPDGAFFAAIAAGRADVVTDTIARITADGIETTSGATLAADVIVTATGLELLALGGVQLEVDGEPVGLANTVAYKGMMLAGVPNFVVTLGYTNASWTLKADLIAHYVIRLLRHLRRHRLAVVTPVAPPFDDDELEPMNDLKSGYVLRNQHALPRQGPRPPWRLRQNYLRDLSLLRWGRLHDGVRFDRGPARSARAGRP